MKIKCFVLAMVLVSSMAAVKAQSYEIEQLILDWEKLSALKNILSDLYKGYEILSTGYETIRSISEGNFNLHRAFLDGLLDVSSTVKKYKRVSDIIDYQSRIVSEYKSSYNRFKQDKHFNPDEIVYLGNVYNNLVGESEKNLDNLINVITTGKFRMSDDERLHAVDRIYADTKDQLMFLRQFNSSTALLAAQRATASGDVGTVQKLYGISP